MRQRWMWAGVAMLVGLGAGDGGRFHAAPPPSGRPAQPLLPVRPEAVVPSPSMPADYRDGGTVEVFGNFETAGVLARPGDDVPAARIERVECFLNVNGAWAPVHDLVQVGTTPWYATSLFWLKPGSEYQVKVVFKGRDGEGLATACGAGRTRPEPTVPNTRRTLHVSPAGDDANPGSPERPLRTVGRAFALAEPNLTIQLRAGVYFEGDLELARGGQEGGPIVIRAFPDETAIMDGADPRLLDAAVWQDAGGGIYTHAFDGPCSNVTLIDRETGEHVRLLPLLAVDQLRTQRVPEHGSFADLGIAGAFVCDGSTMHLRPPRPLPAYTIHAAARTKCMRFDRRRNIVVDGLTIRHYGKGAAAGGLMAYAAADVLIQNCRFEYVDTPIWVKLGTDRLTVQDCTFTDGMRDWPFGMLKAGAACAGFEAGAVYVDAKYSGRGLVVRRNHIQGLFDGAHLTSWTEDEARSNETDFYQNTVLDCVDDFVEVDGFARNVRVFDNYMRRALTGISLAQALDGPTFCLYNVIGDCGVVPATRREGNPGYPFKTNGGPGAETGSGAIFLYHNTAFTLDPQSRAGLVKHATWRKITCRNNIWFGRALGFEVWRDPPSPIDLDYDDIYVANADAPLFQFAYRKKLFGLEAVRRERSWMKHGISADPLVVDEQAGVYRLKPTSPCVDAGVVVPGINEVRMRGKAPDLGAYELR